MPNRYIDFLNVNVHRLLSFFKGLNRWVLSVISILVTLAILGILAYRQKDIILNYKWQFRPIPILLSFIIFSIALFWMSIVWGWVMNNMGGRVKLSSHIRYYIISNLAKRIPGTIWYVASRFQFYISDGISRKITTLASGIEFVLSTLAGILVTLIFSTQTLIEYKISPIILIMALVIGLVIIHPKFIHWLLIKRNVEITVLSYRFVIKVILFYFLSWILGGIILFEFGNIIYPIPIENLPYIINAWALVGIISTLLLFSPSNLGVTEIGLSLLLSKILPSSIAVLIAISARILMIMYEILWAGVFLIFNSHRKQLLTQKD